MRRVQEGGRCAGCAKGAAHRLAEMPLAEPLPPPLDDAMAVLEEPPAEEVSLPPPLPGPLRKAKLVFCRLLGRPTPTISVVVQRGFQEASRERATQIQRQCVAASKSKVLHTISKVERARTKTSNLYLSSSVSAIFATSGGAGTSVRLNAAGPKVPKDYDWSTDALRPGVAPKR